MQPINLFLVLMTKIFLLPIRLTRNLIHQIISWSRMRALFHFVLSILALVVFCEFFLGYLLLLRCTWPYLANENLDKFAVPLDQEGKAEASSGRNSKPVHAVFLSDPHITSKYQSRFNELHLWRMARAIRAILFIHDPELIFILGDVLDSGTKTYSASDFNDYFDRFNYVFPPSSWGNYRIKVIAGNHDIGFHYDVTPLKDRRFRQAFYGDALTSNVRIFSRRGVHFVLLNSMAFEGDDCDFCAEAETDLEEVTKQFRCIRGDDMDPQLDCRLNNLVGGKSFREFYDLDSDPLQPGFYSRPIVLQHYPMYRKNDLPCDSTQRDAMPESERSNVNRQRWDCLSLNATNRILKKLKPRLVLSGHTHYSCSIEHETSKDSAETVQEISVASASTRNLPNPSLLLMQITPYDYSYNKCYLPTLNEFIIAYMLGFLLIVAHQLSFAQRFYKYLEERQESDSKVIAATSRNNPTSISKCFGFLFSRSKRPTKIPLSPSCQPLEEDKSV